MAIEIDLDLLNELFENQEKLERNSDFEKQSIFEDCDLFNERSIFDDQADFDGSLSLGNAGRFKGGQDDTFGIMEFHPNTNLSLDYDDEIFQDKSRKVSSIVLPVIMEIAVISCGYLYFS